MMTRYLPYIITVLICVLCIFITIIVSKKKYKIGGTMHIDTSREDKDICLFTLNVPLEDLKKEHYILIKIDSESNLKSWEN